MNAEETKAFLNTRTNRIGGQPATRPGLNLVDLAVGNGQAPVPAFVPAPAPSNPEPKPEPATEPAKSVAPVAPVVQAVEAAKPATMTQLSAKNKVIELLLLGPERIESAQKNFNSLNTSYNRLLVEKSLTALSEPLFPGKKPEDGMRPASNDTEREMAIAKVTSNDNELIKLASSRETALAALMREKNTFEAAKLIAQLLTSNNN